MIRFFVLLLAALAVAGCHFDSPVFTPKPGDYPCHRADGSADPNAVSCRAYDGSPTCCFEHYACVPDACEFQGNPNWESGTFGAQRKRVPRSPE